MKEKMARMLGDAIFEVFETMFFLCPEPVVWGDEEMALRGARCDDNVFIQIKTEEESPLSIVLALSRNLLRRMSENLLGIGDEDLTGETILDTAREAANMVGGVFLSRLEPTRRRRMGIPEILSVFDRRNREWIPFVAKIDGDLLGAYLCLNNDVSEVLST